MAQVQSAGANFSNSLAVSVKWILFALFLVLPLRLEGQTRVPIFDVNYLAHEPTVDGKLDSDLSYLPVRIFQVREKSNPHNPDTAVNYRIAYNERYFYLYVEMNSPTYICRDRGYQNGDGFSLVLGRPMAQDMPTNDYYIFGFSAQDDPARKWAKAMLWNRDYDARLDELGPEVLFAYARYDGKVGFELLLPWTTAYPYHPWMMDEIGFNLFFVQAIGAVESNFYSAFPDPASGEASDRSYLKLQFMKPSHPLANGGLLVAEKNHVFDTERIVLHALTWSAADVRPGFHITLRPLEKSQSSTIELDTVLPMGNGIRAHRVLFDKDIPAAAYSLHWAVAPGTSAGSMEISVLPMRELQEARSVLEKNRQHIAPGSVQTLEFRIQDLERIVKSGKFYDALTDVPRQIADLARITSEAEKGIDTLADARGYLRRGLRSHIDGTLQPYSVYVPSDLDRRQKYPLLVYLHGSSRDDTELRHIKFLQHIPGVIVMAPFARDMSNYYLPEIAQKDVLEAVDDVARNYPVDESRIALSGFSMGGYGVYRLYDYAPARFKALAVFGGEPRIDPQIPTADPKIDYRDQSRLLRFSSIPIFIFHGREDLNCPFKLTDELVASLRPLNPNLVVNFVEGEGHHIGPESQKMFVDWLQRTLAIHLN